MKQQSDIEHVQIREARERASAGFVPGLSVEPLHLGLADRYARLIDYTVANDIGRRAG